MNTQPYLIRRMVKEGNYNTLKFVKCIVSLMAFLCYFSDHVPEVMKTKIQNFRRGH